MNMILAIIGLALSMVIGLTVPASAGATKIVEYTVTDESSIEKSLTGVPGDAKKGRALAINRKRGNCLACHQMPINEQQFHGNIGPELEGVGDSYSAGELRLRIVNSKIINPDTIMPAFYKNAGYSRVLKKFKGKTILSAQEVEDIVAYLLTIK